MSKVMTAKKFVETAIDIAKNYKTLYVMGCFGAPMTQKNKQRYSDNCSYNRKPERKKKIMAASSDTFGFDCVNLIKGILWGWDGDITKTYGGAKYGSNGVPDIGANYMMNYCTEKSTSFKNIVAGEVVHLDGHIGIYIGDGLVAECSPRWKDKVQITACANIGEKKGYNSRKWSSHGKLKFIDYSVSPKGGVYMFEVERVLKGTSGEDTLLCQKLLKVDGYKGKDGKVLALDGKCGDNTVFAITKFQEAKGITPVDGICGKKTWAALLGV